MRSAFLVNPFGAREQELADPIERIVFAVPVSEGFVLDSPAHRVQAPVPDPHHMKGVGDPQGCGRGVGTCRPGSARSGRRPPP